MQSNRIQIKKYLLGFTVFKEKVKNGEKRQSIRKIRRFKGRLNPCRVGYLLRLYWHLRKRDCELLRSDPCLQAFFINILYTPLSLETGQPKWRVVRYLNFDGVIEANTGMVVLNPAAVEDLAKRDGFNSAAEMMAWFYKAHPREVMMLHLEPQFQVIRW